MAQTGRTNWSNLVTLVSVLIIIGAEVFGVALAGGWAIAGIFELGETVRYILMALFCALGGYAMLALWRRSVRIDPITG